MAAARQMFALSISLPAVSAAVSLLVFLREFMSDVMLLINIYDYGNVGNPSGR